MRVSFVIPTRNQAAFIAQSIDSCLAQNVASSEVIVVDGASTDNTREVLARYGDRIRWISEPDRGQSDAVNKGVRMASGDLIAWLNSDDYYDSDQAVQRLVAEFDQDPTLDIVYGDGLRVDKDGVPLGPHTAHPIKRVADIVTQPASFVLQPSLVFRRQLFLDVGGVDESLHYTMDYDLWIRMFAAARATRYIPSVISHARYYADAKSVQGMGKQIREFYKVKRANARKLKLGPVDLARMYAGIASLGMYWVAVRSGLKRTT